MKKRLFIKNALILTVTAILLRTAGMFLRIYMSNAIGAQGMGLYQLIMSVYVLAATFSTSGISIAVTRVCTDELACGSKRSVKRVIKKSLLLSISVSALLTCCVYVFADEISLLFIDDKRAIAAVRILSLSLVPMGISAVFKGYFMARRNAKHPSIAQMLEQAVRMAAVMYFLIRFADKGIEYSCYVILLADTIAEACSCVFIWLCYLLDKRKLELSKSSSSYYSRITREILKISAPIIANKYVCSTLHTAESMLVPKCLQSFCGTRERALSEFGMLRGMAMPVLFFPSSFLMSMSTLLVPEISEAKATGCNKSIQKDVSYAIRITLLMSMLIAAIFIFCSDDLGMIIYKSSEIGFLIKVLSPLVPVMYMESMVDGILKGLNQQNSSLLYCIIDSFIRIGLILTLVSRMGMAGFLIMMVVSNLFTSLMNLRKLVKVTGIRFDVVNWMIKPLIAASAAIGITYIGTVNFVISQVSHLVISLCIISLLYVAILYIINGLPTKKLTSIKNVGTPH